MHVYDGGGVDVGVGVGVGVGGGVGFLVGVGVGWPCVGVGVTDGGGVTKGDSDGPIVALGKGVGKGWKVTIGGGDGAAVGVGVMGTKIGSDETGEGVPVAEATPPPPGRAKATSMAPMTSPTRASASAAMIGSRLLPDATARRLGYVTPAASPATGKRW